MRKSLVLVGIGMLSSLVAFATDEAPRYETFLGYDFVRFNPNSGIVPSFNANGGSGQFVYNFDKWFGAVMDLGAVTKGTLGGYSVDTTVFNFVAGPRFTYHNQSRFTPFGEALFGGAYATTSTQITLPFIPGVTPPIAVPPVFCPNCVVNPLTGSTIPVSARLVASGTHFAMLAGGGLDIRVSKHMSFRPFEVDYFLTRMPALTGNHTNQNNLRYSAGVNFQFGAQ
jgi:hypothetical protein